MLSHNIRTIRNEKKLSQEEIAVQLNVVRQTVSKWEKGLSVPDAQLLIKLAKILDVSVSVLLGDDIESSIERNVLAERLVKLNAQLSNHNIRSKHIWTTVKAIFGTILVIMVLILLLSISK